MFTGLIESIGVVRAVKRSNAGLELVVESTYRDLNEGESIALNGACLTVREITDDQFSVAAIGATVDRTAIGTWGEGKRVNLERALRFGDRLGGHLVQGHVDCVGRVLEASAKADYTLLSMQIAGETWEMLAPRGSISVDGVSLTVSELPARGIVEVSLIEYTLSHTTLADLAPDDDVHIEADILGKHVQRLLAPYLETRN